MRVAWHPWGSAAAGGRSQSLTPHPAAPPAPALQFTIVSAVGIIWECAVFCYLGSMAENVTAIASDAGASGVWEWILLGVSLVMCVAAAVLVSFSLK